MSALEPSTTPANWVDCPRCGGWGDHGLDDEGRQFLCYHCYGTGNVLARQLDEEEVQ